MNRYILRLRFLLPIIFTVLFINISQAQVVQVSSRAHALANGNAADICEPGGAANPALTGYRSGSSVEMSLSRPYSIAELWQSEICGLFSVSGIPVGIQAEYFGNKIYKEIRASLRSSLFIPGNSRLGIAVNYLRMDIPGFYTKDAVTVSFGCIREIVENMVIGAAAENAAVLLSDFSVNPHPTFYRLGIGFERSGFRLFLEGRKQNAFPVQPALGIETGLFAGLALRSGVILNPEIFTFGMGYRILSNRFDVGLQVHQYLGTTFSTGIIFKSRD